MVRIRPYWLILALAIDAHAIGFNTNAWPTYTNLRLSNAIVTNVYAALQSITFTNYTSPTSTVIITDTFLSDVWPTLESTNLITNRWPYPLTRYSGTVAWTYHYTAQTAVARTPTNVAYQAQDVWAYDTYQMTVERHRMLMQGDQYAGSMPSPPKLYRNTRDSLHSAKQWWGQYASLFVPVSTNPVIGTNFVTFTVSNLLSSCNLPTNYFAWTPNRGLSGVGNPYYRLTTTTWVIVTSGAGTVTQSTWDACGNSVSVIGTNGQIATKVCTNDSIAEGFNSLAYGFSGMTAIAARTVWTWEQLPAYLTSPDTQTRQGNSVASWADAQSSLGSIVTNGTILTTRDGPGLWTRGSYDGSFWSAFQEWQTVSNAAGWGAGWPASTNISGATLTLEMWGRAVPPDYPGWGQGTFDLNGVAVGGVTWSTNWQSLNSASFTNGQFWGGVPDNLGFSVTPTWCDEPTGTNRPIRGFQMEILGLIRGDVTNGLRYR